MKFRRKNIKEASDICRSKMEEKEVAVQRLALLVPAPSSTTSPPGPSSAASSDPLRSSSPGRGPTTRSRSGGMRKMK